MTPAVRVFVQARMSSRRFPGKVLAPFRDRPILWHVLTTIERALPGVPVVVATSGEASDDPLALYAGAMGVDVFRGPLDDVFARFRQCADAYPCEWMLRICADSPLLEPQVLRDVVGHPDRDACDVVTTVFPRTFPSGQNAELIRTAAFRAVDVDALSAEEREHATQVFYRQPNRYRIRNVVSGDPDLVTLALAVDTVEDLRRLEQCSASR